MPCRTALAGGLLLALGAFPLPAVAAVANLQASKDNTLYQHATGGVSNGAGSFLFAGKNGVGEVRRGLLKFDVAGGIPAGSTIHSATLTLYYDNSEIAANGTRTVGLRRVTADWGEGVSDAAGNEGSGAASTPGDATWVHTFFNTSLWTSQGGDFSGTTTASTVVGITAGAYAWTGATLTADVQDMFANPGGNFGWGVFGDESSASTAKRFGTHENPTASERPVLSVDYTPPPEVSTLPPWGPMALASVLLVVALPMMRRRTE